MRMGTSDSCGIVYVNCTTLGTVDEDCELCATVFDAGCGVYRVVAEETSHHNVACFSCCQVAFTSPLYCNNKTYFPDTGSEMLTFHVGR